MKDKSCAQLSLATEDRARYSPSMFVEGPAGANEDARLNDVVAELQRRRTQDQAAEYLISEVCRGFPYLNILVRGENACVHYFPEEGQSPFLSQGPEWTGNGTFVFDFGQGHVPMEIADSALVALDDAIATLKAFWEEPSELPPTIEWLELLPGPPAADDPRRAGGERNGVENLHEVILGRPRDVLVGRAATIIATGSPRMPMCGTRWHGPAERGAARNRGCRTASHLRAATA